MTHDDYDMPCLPLLQPWTPFNVEFVTHQHSPLLPLYLNARVNLLWTRLGLQLALSLLSSCPFRRCPMARIDATFVQCASLVHLSPGTSENIGPPYFCFYLLDCTSVPLISVSQGANLMFFSFVGRGTCLHGLLGSFPQRSVNF